MGYSYYAGKYCPNTADSIMRGILDNSICILESHTMTDEYSMENINSKTCSKSYSSVGQGKSLILWTEINQNMAERAVDFLYYV